MYIHKTSMSQATVYLVTGSNRGIGLGLVTHILEKHDNAFVYAGVRDPDNASSLQNLRVKYSNRIAVVKCVSADVESNAALGRKIEKHHGHLDTVIANAGICGSSVNVSKISPATIEEHFHVNVMGPVILFQAVYDLLKKSKSPRFIPISSIGGCMDGAVIRSPTRSVAYGATKAALNWTTRKIHFENDWLIAFPLSPGPVDTDMLRFVVDNDKRGALSGALKKLVEEGASASWPTVETASVSLLKVIDESTREKDGGEFTHVDGTRLPW
ncbi:hypothetical protein HYPSUDRAFT_186447 [Hypholoma sublateritium FD-334 SS-4]|uniref:Ketoreductase (KR) domain-containing protein n=1 Tax=Hypholoma sublateritium (strain FD-334 SS-4) TaxID=945553 RepID=A0A0D2NTT3_HYPSF|nr:hypothetical protein HYPSUDRAFT_186447 [Hypholoma sublateritium FD-334 SS-4]